MLKLSGKAAIVIGAGRGIGEAIAKNFGSKGAAVVIADINMEMARHVADEIKDEGGTAIAFEADVTNRLEVQDMVKTTIEEFKAVHILVNNAGAIWRAPFLELTEECGDATIDVNLKGVFNCSQVVLRHLMEQRYGKIINISSIAGIGHGQPEGAGYAAAKAGVVELTRVTARVAGQYGINVNCIAPGAIDTGLAFAGRGREEIEMYIQERKKSTLLGCLGRPEDVANLALFLACDDSSFTTGQVIAIDGGRIDGV